MILEKIKAKNFLSFRDLEVSFGKSQFVTIVGPNNSGKTNFVRALRLLKEACGEPTISGDIFLYHGSSEFSVSVSVSLSEEEKEDLRFFLEVWLKAQFKLANKSSLNNIKANWNIKEEKQVEEIISKFLLSDFLSYLERCLERFIIDIKYTYGQKILGYPTVEFNTTEQTLYLTHDAILTYSERLYPIPIIPIISWLEGFSKQNKKPEELTSQNLLKMIIQRKQGIEARGPYLEHVLNCLTAEERRKLDELLSKYSLDIKPTDNFTLLSFLLSLFKTRIFILEEIRSYPKKEFDEDQYKKLRQLTTYSGKGEELFVFLLSLMLGSPDMKKRFEEIKNRFIKLTSGIEFDLEERWQEDRKCKVSLQFLVPDTEKDKFNTVSHYFVGSGFLEILNILTVCVGNKDSVIILDEPALHLHPTKQKQIIEQLFEFKETNQNQIFLITHSPYMVLKDALQDTYYFSLKEEETRVTCLAQIIDQIIKEAGEERVIKEFEFYPYKEMLFANSVLFVEGESEAIGISFILKNILEQKNIFVFNVRGMEHFEIPIKVAKSLGIPFITVGDAKAKDTLERLCPDSYFALKQDDFVDFLKDCLPETFQKHKVCEKEKIKKPETTIAVLSNADPEEFEKAKQEFKPLAKLIKEKFNM